MLVKNSAGKVIKSDCFRSVNATFTFEPWMIAGSDHTVHALGAAWALAGIKDNEFIRISVADQKTLFGKAILGKQAICLRNGQFQVLRTCSYGGDFDSQYLTDIMKDNNMIAQGYSDHFNAGGDR